MFSKKMVLLLSVLFSMFLFNGFAEAKVEDPEKGQQGQGNIPVSRGEFIKRPIKKEHIIFLIMKNLLSIRSPPNDVLLLR